MFGTINNQYIELFNIPKKNPKRTKQYREVINIKSPYNLFYKELLYIIEETIKENTATFISMIAHGFIKNRGVLTNAKEHLNQKYLLKIDIRDYFKSIPKDGIYDVFLKLGFSQTGAEIFSKLCTFNDILYEGFSTSPILANLYCFDFDLELQALADTYNVKVSRYSDDITFSSNVDSFPPIHEIEKVLNDYSFKINEEKTIRLKYGQPQYVTGLSISNNKYPRVPKRLKRKIRQELYYLQKYPENYFNVEDNYPHLRAIYGQIVYILGIEKSLGKRYQAEFIDAIEKNNIYLENIFMDAPKKKDTITTYHYIDESEFIEKATNRHYLILSLVSINGSYLKNSISEKIISLKTDLVTDLRNGLTDLQRENLFHYVEDNIMVKEKYIPILRTLNIEVHLMFKFENTSMNKQSYQDSYYAIFNSLVSNILRRYKNNTNKIIVEENSKISLEELKKILLSKNSFYPTTIISKASKDDVLSQKSK